MGQRVLEISKPKARSVGVEKQILIRNSKFFSKDPKACDFTRTG